MVGKLMSNFHTDAQRMTGLSYAVLRAEQEVDTDQDEESKLGSCSEAYS